MSSPPSGRALACVMGNTIWNLVRALGLADIPCAVVTRPGGPTLYSRFTRAALCWKDFSVGADELVEVLVRFGAAQPEPPVLFYNGDVQLLFVSRYRERLAEAFRFVIADPVLVEDLVDKARFQLLAERLDLPVPAARPLYPSAGSAPPDLDLRYPVIIKPFTRREPWDALGAGKALQIDSSAALRDLWPRLITLGTDLLAQELVPGPESRVESYHVYADQDGTIVGEFTGRKIRTWPTSYGHSSALVTTDAADVRALGRDLVQAVNLRGVAKLDFKRDPEGRLRLLEINPRFNLWHHLGAVAGVNLPALVYGDMVGLPRPRVELPRAGVHWCRVWEDLPAARASGIPFVTWLLWVLRCEAKSAMAWDDPMPLLRGALSRWSPRRIALKRRERRAQPRGISA